jgi:Dehydrogenases with different specificities (related to short-chain alcohol dehydrogenases)
MEGKSAVVTGGANGIGRATARALLELGVNVAIIDYDREALTDAELEFSSCAGSALIIFADLSSQSEINAAFDTAIRKFGRLDILVNSAARLGGDYDLLNVDPDDWDKTFRVNVRGVLITMQLFARQAITAGGGGRIVNLSSSSAFRAQNTRPAYGCAKGAVNTLTRIAAAQLGPHDINVNAVAPGITNTPGATTKRGVPFDALQKKVSDGPNANFFKRVTEASEVADVIAFLCGPGGRQITGQVVNVSAGAVV